MPPLLTTDAIGDPSRGFAWSAHDPDEQSIDSDDPLGFGAAALFLADELVPHLNVRTIRLRYYGMLCGGLDLIDEHQPAADESERRELFLRWERLWVLWQPDTTRGLLGVRGRNRYVAGLGDQHARLDHRFRMLTNQAFGGALGAYKPSAEALGLLDPGELTLTPAGEAVARVFWRAIRHRGKARRACWESIRKQREHPAPYSLKGFRAMLRTLGLDALTPGEAAVLGACIFDDDIRSATLRMARPGLEKEPADLYGLRAIAKSPAASQIEQSRKRTATAALALDGFIVRANFVLDQMVDAAAGHSLSLKDFIAGHADWGRVQQQLVRAADRAARDVAILAPVTDDARFCAKVSGLAGTQLLRVLLDRHQDVMTDRRARRWLALDGGKILAERHPQGVRKPALIRHAFRLGQLRSLAKEADRL